MTNRERILAALARSTYPLDDDELARRAGVSARQSVNQICNRLAVEKVIIRGPGANGKIASSLSGRSPFTASADEDASLEAGGASVAGSSHEQRAAEAVMLVELSAVLGVQLAPRRITHPSGARVELDGADPELTTLVECWAHQGPAKVAQKYKLVNDAVKLHWIAGSLPQAPERLILCVSDPAAIRHLVGRSWQGQAISELGVELHSVTLPEETIASIAQAQKRQYR